MILSWLPRYQESWKVLAKHADQDSGKVKELRAQLCYRMEKYDKSFELFQGVMSQISDEYTEERITNVMAAAAMGQQNGTVTHFDIHDTTFEQCFNSACCYLAISDGVKAERMLVMAEEKCRTSLQEDDYTDEEIEEEISVIRLQLGCAFLLQGKTEQAMQQFTTVLKQKPDDVIQTIVASNNIVVLNRDRDIFDSKKRIKVLSNEPKLSKMTSLQRLSILYNRCLFALHMNHLEQCKQLLKEMDTEHPNNEMCLMANLALLNRERKSTNTDKMQALVDEYLAKSFSVKICLLGAQLPLNAGSDLRKVCQILQQIPQMSQYLGIVATMVSFLTQLGAPQEAIQLLDNAVEYWEKQPRSSISDSSLLRIMQENAQYKLVHGEHQLAAMILEKLHRRNPLDIQVLAQLIDAYSKFNPSKAEQFSKSLPTFQHSASIDIDALEQAPQYIRKLKEKQSAVLVKGKAQDKEVKAKLKPKRKRKIRYPKNYDPKVAPDPERWLPLRERSYYKKGKKRGFVPVSRGAQGSSIASNKLMSQLDASKSSTAATPTVTTSPKPTKDGEQPAAAKPPAQTAAPKKKPPAKKKKKGKGW